jgi:hypothetical protein
LAASGKLGRQPERMLGKAGKLGILTGSSKDFSVAGSDRTPPLTLKRTGHDCRPAGLGASPDEFVDELDQLIRETYSDLLAHTVMVPLW